MRQAALGLGLALAALACGQELRVDRAELPKSGGPVLIEGTWPSDKGDPIVELESPDGARRPLRAYVTAMVDGVQNWSSGAVLAASKGPGPAVYKIWAGGESRTIRVADPAASGDGNGVKATYYFGQDFRSPAAIRNEAMPCLKGAATLPLILQGKGFSARWEGSLRAPSPGKYKLVARTNRTLEIRMGGRRALQVFNPFGESKSAVLDLAFAEGEAKQLAFELKSPEPGGQLEVAWSRDGGPEAIIPVTQWQAPNAAPVEPLLKVEAAVGEKRLKHTGGAYLPLVEAASPYGGARAWTRVYSEEGELLDEVPAGMPVVIPPNPYGIERRYILRHPADDDALARTVAPGMVLVLEAKPPAPPPPVRDLGPDPDDRQPPREAPTPLRSRTENRRLYEPMARAAAKRHGLDENVFCRMIEAESSWNPEAVSRSGAMGLGQLMPGTAAMLGVDDPWDPEQNLDGAARYLAQQHRRFGSYRLALAAYNAGPGNVIRHGGVPPFRETQNYVRKILGD